MAWHGNKQQLDQSLGNVHTYEGAYKGGALGSRLQALPSDAQLAQVGGQAVKACAAGHARGLYSTCCQGALHTRVTQTPAIHLYGYAKASVRALSIASQRQGGL